MPGFLRKFREWRAREVAYEALSRMDSRMLADIGIEHRSDIRKYIRGLNL